MASVKKKKQSGRKVVKQPTESAIHSVARAESAAKRKHSTLTHEKPTAKQLAVEKLMARFEDARPSDVSEKVFVASSPVHGKGLFAARRIKADTVIARLHGMPTYDDGIYVLWITDELGLELTNDLKFINHDKQPNAAYSDLDVTVLRDIEPGEELLHDYGW